MSGIVDDADPAVVYSGNWGAYSGWATTYKGTIHQSSALNDQATLTFQGIGVLVNSGQQGVGWRVRSSYSIDGGSPTVYSNDSYQSTTEAYRSSTLSNGQHTLTVVNLDSRKVYLFLDSFMVFTPDDTAVSSSSSSYTTTTTTSTRGQESSSTIVSSNSNTARSGTTASTASVGFLAATSMRSSALGTPDASSTPSPSSASTKSKDPSQILLIVAPIFGAVVICGIIFLLLRRRRKQKELSDSLVATPASSDPNRFPPEMLWANGQKPSSFLHDSSQPPPYVQEPQLSSFTPNRQPTKFRTG